MPTEDIRATYEFLFLEAVKRYHDEPVRAQWSVFCEVLYDVDAGGHDGRCTAEALTCSEGGLYFGAVEYPARKATIDEVPECVR